MQDSQNPPKREQPPTSSRRRFFAGAAGLGAAATAVAVLPRVQGAADAAPEPVPAAPEKGGGYRMSEHVKRYYRSTAT